MTSSNQYLKNVPLERVISFEKALAPLSSFNYDNEMVSTKKVRLYAKAGREGFTRHLNII